MIFAIASIRAALQVAAIPFVIVVLAIDFIRSPADPADADDFPAWDCHSAPGSALQ